MMDEVHLESDDHKCSSGLSDNLTATSELVFKQLGATALPPRHIVITKHCHRSPCSWYDPFVSPVLVTISSDASP